MEPIYTYKKGEGWTPSLHIGVTRDGKRCQLLPRIPEKGECYLYRSGKRFVNEDGSIKIEGFVNEVGKFFRNDWGKSGFEPSSHDPYYTYVTLVWLD